MTFHFGPLVLAALGVLFIWVGINGYRKGDFPTSRIPASRRKNPRSFWFAVITLVASGIVTVVIGVSAAFELAFNA